MTKFPVEDQIISLQADIENLEYKSNFSKSIGPSTLCHPCNRFIFFKYHWCDSDFIPSRIMRLFNRGNTIENAIISDIKQIKHIKIISTQQKAVAAQGHIKSFCDAIIEGLPESKQKHLVEIKSAKQKYFTAIKNNGVKKAYIDYFLQMQMYFYLYKLKRGLLIVQNKEDDKIHIERVKKEGTTGIEYLKRGVDIINAKELPKPIDESFKYKCNYCAFIGICKEKKEWLKNCRTCRFSKPIYNGLWLCQKSGKKLLIGAQLKGCKLYKQMVI